MRRITGFLVVLAAVAAAPVFADMLTLVPTRVTDWKAVFGRIEARDNIPARARIGGTLTELAVHEGDRVAAGDVLGRIVDDKIDFQLSAYDAQVASLRAQLANAETELKRGEDLMARGVATAQQLDQLRTQVTVLEGQIDATVAQRRVVEQQAAEGVVLAPLAGRVLQVPVAHGAVVMPGEAMAIIGGGGIYLRLAVPERFAPMLNEGDAIAIEEAGGAAGDAAGGAKLGHIERVYPQIENGRVLADVAVEGMSDRFIDARVLVRLPVTRREALVVPPSAVITRLGLDFVAVEEAGGARLRAVVVAAPEEVGGVPMVEVLSGLKPGEVIRTDGAAAAAAGQVAAEPETGRD